MDWETFFKLTVLKETLQGPHLYFQSELKIPTDFSIDELSMREFDHLPLSDEEKKRFNLTFRKIFLRHRYFRSGDFERIVDNFAERIAQEKEQLLTFSTQGGGVYLFLSIQKKYPEVLNEKRVICFTSEPPLNIMGAGNLMPNELHLILHPHARSFFRSFPALWDKSNLVDLYHAHEA